MAEIIGRKTANGRTRYYVRFIDADGKRKMRAAPPGTNPRSGAARLKAAEDFTAALQTRVRNGKVGIVEPTPEERARATVTLGALAERFKNEYRPPRLKNPTRYHVDAASVFGVRILPIKLPGRTVPFAECAAASVTPLDVERLRDSLTADGYAANSVRHTLRSLSRLYTWARRVGAVDCGNPVSGIERPAAVATIDYLDSGEVARLLAQALDVAGAALSAAAPSAEAVYCMIAVAVYGGLRKGELFGLRWRDLDLDAGRLTVARSYRLLPKSGKVRHVPINPELAPALRRWKKRCPPTDEGLVFPVPRESGKDWRIGRADDDLGLPALLTAAKCHQPADGRPWHLLRHTMASHFMMRGGNILSLQKLLGHGDLKMTLLYAHLAPDFMLAEIARMTFAEAPGADVLPLDAVRGRQEAEQRLKG
jgi:integrase